VSAAERSGSYRVVRPLRYVAEGGWRAIVYLPIGDVVERVLLADLPPGEALPMRAMLERDECDERDERAWRRASSDVVFFRAAGQVRSAVYGQDVTAYP